MGIILYFYKSKTEISVKRKFALRGIYLRGSLSHPVVFCYDVRTVNYNHAASAGRSSDSTRLFHAITIISRSTKLKRTPSSLLRVKSTRNRPADAKLGASLLACITVIVLMYFTSGELNADKAPSSRTSSRAIARAQGE